MSAPTGNASSLRAALARFAAPRTSEPDAFDADRTEKILAELRAGLAEILGRTPAIAFLASGKPAAAVLAWPIVATDPQLRAVIEADGEALAILVAQMFGAGPEDRLDGPRNAVSALDAGLATVLVALLAKAASAALSVSPPLRLGDPVDVAAGRKDGTGDEPAQLTIGLSGYGRTGCLTLRARALRHNAGANGATQAESAGAAWNDRFERVLDEIRVPARVILTLEPATLGVVTGWRPGDILPCGHGGDLPVSIRTGARTLMHGELGRDGRNFCVRLPSEPIGGAAPPLSSTRMK